MLNSGGKKLYIKVKNHIALFSHCFNIKLFLFFFFFKQNVICLQDMQVLSKVEASLNVNQVLLRPEAKNFTQVATLACKSDYCFF